MDGDDRTMTTHSVHDGDRVLQFVGEELGRASSETPAKQRWAEITIFRTQGGKYIVAGCGRTVVRGETDRRWAQVFDDPADVVRRLYMVDDAGEQYLPHVSKDALDAARARDEGLRDAF